MKTFSLLSVCIVVLAVAYCCNGLYHFKQRLLSTCDLDVSTLIYSSEKPEYFGMIDCTVHGAFVRGGVWKCKSNSSGECEREISFLYRPDLAPDPKKYEVEFYSLSKHECDIRLGRQDQPGVGHGVLIPYEDYFENREPDTFHGIKCFKYYNSTGKYKTYIFANETSGTLYGDRAYLEKGGYEDEVYSYKTQPFSRSVFTFSEKLEPSCDKTSYQLPYEDIFDHACDAVPSRRF